MKNGVFIFDADNTLFRAHAIYDEAYRLTSSGMFGWEFVMTTNPDGTPDRSFPNMSNPEILARREDQIGISVGEVDQERFFDEFEANAVSVLSTMKIALYPGVRKFLTRLATHYPLAILTSGPRRLQCVILEDAGLLSLFHLNESMFLGDCVSKVEGIERIVLSFPRCDLVVHLGNAPLDMRATKAAQVKCPKIAVGVTVEGATTAEQLIAAGADLVINRYNIRNLQRILKLL